ncbi:MAG TPA: chromate resistance protein ChrB domain-containing protein [Myxococcota bacterium]|nr:chromate resistance protein ChrB domain-containing protein [Myxococcota bacterium]
MLWITRKHIRVNRTATAWLIRRFVDPDARFVFLEPAEVARFERERGDALGFDAPGARYANDGGVTSFEQIRKERVGPDTALDALARIVHGADIAGRESDTPESPGLKLLSRGFPLVARDDHETVEKAAFLYDALYAALRAREA